MLFMDGHTDELLFDALTPLGFRVRVTKKYWAFIVFAKHPVMEGCEQLVQMTLEAPDEVRLSRSDPQVHLFYKAERRSRWVCAVAKRLHQEGFLVTAYPTDAVKEGERIWPR